MKLSVVSGGLETVKAPAIAVAVTEDQLVRLPAKVRALLEDVTFKAKAKELAAVPAFGKLPAKWLIVVGLGPAREVTAETIRRAAAAAAKTARGKQLSGTAFAVVGGQVDGARLGQAVAEGVLLGLYRFQQYKTGLKTDEKHELTEFRLVVARAADRVGAARGLARGETIAEAVNFARGLINQPANVATPTYLAQQAQAMARTLHLRCRVLSRPEARRLHMGAFLSVAAGSVQEPKFIILEHNPKGRRTVVFAGKGITFDTGGISIKPSEGMDRMKYDMAGGAAVLGALRAAAALRLPFHIVGLVAATENMPGGSATRPGDVVRAHNGKTIEILNTDAEGRLVLADALAYAKRFKPQAVVDLATLTGACVVALGSEAIGLMGTDAALARRLRQAGEATGERVWELPLWDEYLEGVKGEVADVKNIGPRGEAGAIMGAAFLKHFVDGYPWVHLDIAGTAWAERERGYHAKGATGVGVRLLVQMLEDWAQDQGTASR
ncbi:MAG: leucyl aminopeptidase [Candidatus Omnitrophica bacterium]|nr:leucyl aminopeptidase [Candidatus Omnitrophota bacterium]